MNLLARLTLQYKNQFGAVAQLGERLHGMQEVVGSIPIGSTGYEKTNTVVRWFSSALRESVP